MTTSEPGPLRAQPRRKAVRLVVSAAILALVIAGAALVVHGVRAPGAPPNPADVGAIGTTPTPAPDPPATTAAAAPPTTALAPSPPVAIAIPSIGVSSPVNAVGLNPDRTLQVPAPGPLYDQAAWYRGSVTPGQIGPSLILGHVDSARNGPSVFYRLGALRPGMTFTVTRADGSAAEFRVDGVRSYPKDAFPTLTVYGATSRPEMRLITCGGDFDRSEHSYRDNTVVFSHLIT